MQNMFEFVCKRWRMFTDDLFANNVNKNMVRFYPKYWCPGTTGVDGLVFDWKHEFFWLVPPPYLIATTLHVF